MTKWLTLISIHLENMHDKTDSHSDNTGENIPLPLVNPRGGSTWEPEREQETSFGGRMSLREELLREQVKCLYRKLSENIVQNPEDFHYDYFEIRKGRLYYENTNRPLTTKDGILRSACEIADILGKNRLRNLGFDVPWGKVTARQAVLLN